MSDRTYPEEHVGSFPSPPAAFTDGEDREIRLRESGRDDVDALVEMYEGFDPADRAQGIPPIDSEAIRDWLDVIVTGDSVSVVAAHDDRLVGHAILVPDRQDGYELAIFILDEYQGAGIGTELLAHLLGAGQDAGVDRVWLTVERWNDAAIALYRKIGFETAGSESFELEMAIRL
jgi:ribosomal protein S18 acetylase RimI-like enzyme